MLYKILLKICAVNVFDSKQNSNDAFTQSARRTDQYTDSVDTKIREAGRTQGREKRIFIFYVNKDTKRKQLYSVSFHISMIRFSRSITCSLLLISNYKGIHASPGSY